LADPVKSREPSADTVPAVLHGAPVVNIVIDVGDYSGDSSTEKAAHDTYIKKINQSVAALREVGIPTIFVAITEINQIHENIDAEMRTRLKLNELDVRAGDVVFEKRFMSGFTTLEEILSSRELERNIISQRGEHGGAEYAKAFEKTHLTLKHILHDAEHVTIMGAMAQYCVTQNACDAAWNGKRVTVFSDTTTAWSKETMEFYEKRARGETVEPNTPRTMVLDNTAFQEEQIKAAIAGKKSSPATMGRTLEEAGALDKIEVGTVQEFLSQHQNLKAPLQKTATSAGSKFLAAKVSSSFLSPVLEPDSAKGEHNVANNSIPRIRKTAQAPKC
jgi:nicotinamidase-related amidase